VVELIFDYRRGHRDFMGVEQWYREEEVSYQMENPGAPQYCYQRKEDNTGTLDYPPDIDFGQGLGLSEQSWLFLDIGLADGFWVPIRH
jgi:hypothetical protein